MTQVAVVGGGITGLAAARRLALAGCDVTVLEAGRRYGGKLAPVVVDGVRLDGGAESMLARRPEATGLVDDLGQGQALVHPTAAKPSVLVAVGCTGCRRRYRGCPPTLINSAGC